MFFIEQIKEWEGVSAVLFEKYLRDKDRYIRLKSIPERLMTFEENEELIRVSNSMKKFILSLNIDELRNLIFMNLDSLY